MGPEGLGTPIGCLQTTGKSCEEVEPGNGERQLAFGSWGREDPCLALCLRVPAAGFALTRQRLPGRPLPPISTALLL